MKADPLAQKLLDHVEKYGIAYAPPLEKKEITPDQDFQRVRDLICEIFANGGKDTDSEAIYVGTTLEPKAKQQFWQWLNDNDQILKARLKAAGQRLKEKEVTTYAS